MKPNNNNHNQGHDTKAEGKGKKIVKLAIFEVLTLSVAFTGIMGYFIVHDKKAMDNYLTIKHEAKEVIENTPLTEEGVLKQQEAKETLNSYECPENFTIVKMLELCERAKTNTSKEVEGWVNIKPVVEFDKVYKKVYKDAMSENVTKDNFEYQKYRDLMDIAMYAEGETNAKLVDSALGYRVMYEESYLRTINTEIQHILKEGGKKGYAPVNKQKVTEELIELEKDLVRLPVGKELQPLANKVDKELVRAKVLLGIPQN